MTLKRFHRKEKVLQQKHTVQTCDVTCVDVTMHNRKHLACGGKERGIQMPGEEMTSTKVKRCFEVTEDNRVFKKNFEALTNSLSSLLQKNSPVGKRR
ncbi:hypothetical protein CEXT_693131 [Caerostris extrusa]|uniref:Uncharacterized protein n=1 Tax=Caerostris extrusa TaxID=172846 RepID=A0AAV4T1C4_CAEEX|nr:hypothetical protein CEXT_693131 [Caerostris extrusa]